MGSNPIIGSISISNHKISVAWRQSGPSLEVSSNGQGKV